MAGRNAGTSRAPRRPAGPLVRCPRCRAESTSATWPQVVAAVLAGRGLACGGCGSDIDPVAVIGGPVDVDALLHLLETGAARATATDAPASPVDDVFALRAWGEKYLPATFGIA